MFLVAGLILLLAGSHWFSGAETVGLILLIPAALEVVTWLFALGIMGAAGKRL
jgi:hypothetical protein